MINLHYNPAISWQSKRVKQMQAGLETLGFFVRVTNSTVRINSDPCVLFGTSAFKQIEAVPGDWLLVDRACWGDPDYVRLGWNGRGLNADYMVGDLTRPVPKIKKTKKGDKVILCGDYGSVPSADATHFKPHPADPHNPTDLPMVDNFDDCDYAVVGASTVAIELILQGIAVVITDPSNMANMPLEWLAHTQWSWDEIERGEPIGHLFQWLK